MVKHIWAQFLRHDLGRRMVGAVTAASLAVLQIAVGTPPANAQIVPDTNGPKNTRPTVTNAPNGVDQIDIARPNGAGLSHNRYTDFNVSRRGAILNNSGSSHVSALGGRILGNPNLTGRSARIILNEVTSTNRSRLRGALEVSGNRAEVVVANPNGITCNGCGFINTPRATLTTGVPQIGDRGNLVGLEVNKGTVTIGPNGLNANGADYFDIIARAVEINGVVSGRNVAAFLGRNDFNYVTRVATARAPDGSTKPAFGLDSTALGGMYADRVTIIGTEAGVGVRTPPNVVARSGALKLTADGRIVAGGTRSRKATRIRSRSSSVQLTGMVYAGTTADIMAATSLSMTSSATVAAGKDVELSARDIDINSAALLAGVAEDGSFTRSVGAVRVAAIDTLFINGTSTVRAGKQIALSSGGEVRLSGTVDSDRDVSITATDMAGDIDVSAQIRVGRALQLTSGASVRLREETSVQAGSVMVSAASDLENAGIVSGQTAVDLQANEAISQSANGLVLSSGTASITARAFRNDGRLSAAGALEVMVEDLSQTTNAALGGSNVAIRTATLDNAGSILSELGLTLQVATTATNRTDGIIGARDTLTLAADTLVNDGRIDADLVDLSTDGDIANTSNGLVAAREQLALAARSIRGVGDIVSLGQVDLTASQDISLGGTFDAGGFATLSAARAIALDGASTFRDGQSILTTAFTNTGTTLFAKSFDMDLAGNFANSGTIQTSGNARIENGGQFSQSGALLAQGDISLVNAGAITITGQVEAGNDLTLAFSGDATLTADATLASGGALALLSQNDGTRTLTNDGRISTTGNLVVTNVTSGAAATASERMFAGRMNIAGSGTFLSGADMLILTDGSVEANGAVEAANRLDVVVGGSLITGANSRLVGGSTLAATSFGSNETIRLGGTSGSAGNVILSGGSANLFNTGSIVSSADIEATFGGTVNNSGIIQADGDARIIFGTAFANFGSVVGRDALTLEYSGTARAALENAASATLGSLGNITVTSANLDVTNAGDVLAGGNADLTVDGSLINSGTIRGDDSTRLVLGTTLTNSGVIESRERVAVRVGSGLDNRTDGVISSGNTLSLSENGISAVALTNSGTISSVADLTLSSTRFAVTNNGLIVTTGDLTFDLNRTLTNTGRLNAAGSLTLASNAAFSNLTGAEIVANDTVTVEVASLSNAGLISGTDVTATLPGDWNATSTGELSARGGTVTVNLGGNFNNNSVFEVGGNFALTAGTITNSSIIVAGGNLSLTARGNVTNSDLILSAGSLLIATDGAIVNDHGVLLSSGSLRLEGRTNSRAALVQNLAGVIESDGAWVRIRANTIDNLSDPVSVQRGVLVSTVVGPEIRIDSNNRRTVTTRIYEDQLTSNGAPGQLLSAGDMVLEATTINNRYSQIAAGRNLSITANTVDNVALDLNRRTETETKNVRRERFCDRRIFGICVDRDTRYITTRTFANTTALYDRKISAITAVGTLGLQLTTSFTNRQDVTQGAAQEGLSAQNELTRFNLPSGGAGIAGALDNGQGGLGSAGSELGTGDDGQLGPGTTTTALGTVNLDDPNTLYALLAGVDSSADALVVLTRASTAFGALFQEADQNSRFVFETRFEFTNLGSFFGSDYFLQRLGISDADSLIRRLGDAYFDTRFIKDQILKLTGLRFLDPEYLNDSDQMRALIENAAAVSGELDLSYGVALTEAQQRALTSDIVWYERQLVGGVPTLVPRLYLANGPRIQGPGALVQAASLFVDAGSITNLASTIRATDQLQLVSTGDLINVGGLLEGGNVRLQAGGDIRVETQLASISLNGGRDVTTLLGRTASVVANEELTILSGGNFDVLAGSVSAGTNLLIDVEGSATVVALEDISSSDGGRDRIFEQRLIGSSLAAGQQLQLSVDGDMVALSSDLSADAGVNLNIGGDFALLAGEELSTYDSVQTNDSLFSSRTTTISQARLTHRSASLSSGGDLMLTVGGDALLAGSNITSAGGVDVLTGGELIASSVVDSTIESRRTQSCSFFCLFGSDNSSTTTQLVNQGSTAQAQADLIARSGGSATFIASSLEAGGDLTLRAGVGENGNTDASINIIAAQDVLNEATRDEEWGLFSSRGGMFMVTYNEENTTTVSTTTNAASQVIAGGNAVLDASRDINIAGSQVEAIGDARLSAGNDINIIAARETQILEETNELSGLGVSLTTSGGGISLFAGYAENEDGLHATSDRSSATIVSAGNNLIVDAGRDINQVGSDLVSGADALLRAGRNINSLAEVDNATNEQWQRELRVGITASLSSSGLTSLDQARSGLENFGAGEGGGIYEAATNLASATNVVIGVLSPLNDFAQGYGTVGIDGGAANGFDRALGLSASVSFGASQSEQSSFSGQGTARPSTIIVGGDLTVIADERIHFEGTQAQAIGDTTISARDVVIESARSTFSQVSESSSFNASIGLSAAVSTQTGVADFGPTASLGGSISDLATDGISNTNSVVSAGGTLSITTLNDLRIEGGNLSGAEVDLDVGGDLVLESRQDISTTNGSSRGLNATVSFTSANGGVNFSDTNGARAWTVGSSITSQGRLEIDTAGNTAISGASIVSATDDLALRTGTLTLEDLDDRDFYERQGGGISGGIAGVSGLSFDVESTREEGITRATIGAGTVEIADLSQEEAMELLDTANRDPEAFQETFLSEHVRAVGDVDVAGLFALPEMTQNVTNLIEAFAAPVPGDVQAQGNEAVELFRKMIVNGVSVDEAIAVSQTEEFTQSVELREQAQALRDSGTILSKADLQVLALSELASYSEIDGDLAVKLQVQCGLFGTNCELIVGELSEILNGEAHDELLLDILEAELRGRGEGGAGQALAQGILGEARDEMLIQALLACSVYEPEVFTQFMNRARASGQLGKLQAMAENVFGAGRAGIFEDAQVIVAAVQSESDSQGAFRNFFYDEENNRNERVEELVNNDYDTLYAVGANYEVAAAAIRLENSLDSALALMNPEQRAEFRQAVEDKLEYVGDHPIAASRDLVLGVAGAVLLEGWETVVSGGDALIQQLGEDPIDEGRAETEATARAIGLVTGGALVKSVLRGGRYVFSGRDNDRNGDGSADRDGEIDQTVNPSDRTGEVFTGARTLSRLDAEGWDLAEEFYEQMRRTGGSVDEIAQNTGLSRGAVDSAYRHLFLDQHQLDDGLRRFDADPEIVNAWNRMRNGTHTSADIDLINHERFEAILMNRYGQPYRCAHATANACGFQSPVD